jgi:hypothetical protein
MLKYPRYEIRTDKNNTILARTDNFKQAVRMATQFRKIYGHGSVRIDTIENPTKE